MNELIDFLLARIAEDEAEAKAAVGDARPDWVVGCEETSDGENVFWAVEALGEESEWFANLGDKSSDHARALHIARHDPARVLAECYAKRRTVEWARYVDGGWFCNQLLPLLALPYADHPDYDEEWRP